MKLNKPKTQLQEVLYYLIKRRYITRLNMLKECSILSLTSRISDLRIRHNLEVHCVDVHTVNKFGRDITYGQWWVSDIKKAVELYKKLQKN